jgi:serine protease inhibitor
VFTVETRREIRDSLDDLGIAVFQEKTANISDDTLDRLIHEVFAQTPASELSR